MARCRRPDTVDARPKTTKSRKQLETHNRPIAKQVVSIK